LARPARLERATLCIEVLAGTAITGRDRRALETYILQNRELLLALWDGQIDQDQFMERQRPVT
jgi:hypothetical protein